MNGPIQKPQLPDPIALMTGRLSGRSLPVAISAPGQGGKFDLEGRVMRWPGNTIICHIDPASKAHQALVDLQNRIKSSPFSDVFTCLPPSSFHMTVFEGIAPFLPEFDIHPDGVSSGTTRDASTKGLKAQLRDVILPRKFRIRPTGMFGLQYVTVEGADPWQEKSLRHARQALKTATGIRSDNFSGYAFHITLAYLIKWVDEARAREITAFSEGLGAEFAAQITEIELGPCELCQFDSMHHFEPVQILNAAGK